MASPLSWGGQVRDTQQPLFIPATSALYSGYNTPDKTTFSTPEQVDRCPRIDVTPFLSTPVGFYGTGYIAQPPVRSYDEHEQDAGVPLTDLRTSTTPVTPSLHPGTQGRFSSSPLLVKPLPLYYDVTCDITTMTSQKSTGGANGASTNIVQGTLSNFSVNGLVKAALTKPGSLAYTGRYKYHHL